MDNQLQPPIYHPPSELKFPVLLPAIVLTALTIALIAFIARHTDPPAAKLIFLASAIPPIALIGLDLIYGGRRSRNPQYFLPTYLFLQMAIAHCIAYHWTSSPPKKQKLWQSIALSLIAAGVISCEIDVQAPTWWGWSTYQADIGNIVDQTESAIVISDARPTQIYPLSYRLTDDVQLLLVSAPETLELPNFTDKTFVYNPSPELYEAIASIKGTELERIYQFQGPSWGISLYKIKN